jgi:DeoR family fructose operon transcriptional repressor
MIHSARRAVLLADHTKVGADHLARFGDLTDIDTFITDTGLDDRTANELESLGPRVVRA